MVKVNEDDLLKGYIKTCETAKCPLTDMQSKLLLQVFVENKRRNLSRNFKFEGLPEVVIEFHKAASEGKTKEEIMEIANNG